MACITLFAQPTAMTTTQFVRVTPYKPSFTRDRELHREQNSPRMNWVVVTDNNGNRELRMHWVPDGDV